MDEDKIAAIATTALQNSHHWLRKYRRRLQEQCVKHSLCEECIHGVDDENDDELTSALKAYVRKMDMNVVVQMDYKPHIDFVSIVPDLPQRPKFDSQLSAGIDLYPAKYGDITIPPHSQQVVHTGLRCYMPEGYFGDIRPRSGLAKHCSIMILAGVVDPSFRGEIKIWLFNPTTEQVTIKAGTAVAQMVLTRYCHDVAVTVDGEMNAKPPLRTHHEGGMGYDV